jgi:hypothetical protein
MCPVATKYADIRERVSDFLGTIEPRLEGESCLDRDMERYHNDRGLWPRLLGYKLEELGINLVDFVRCCRRHSGSRAFALETGRLCLYGNWKDDGPLHFRDIMKGIAPQL